MKTYLRLFVAISILIAPVLSAQDNQDANAYLKEKAKADKKTYEGSEGAYEVIALEAIPVEDKPKNIILMIGDGMGNSHLLAGMIANKGKLFMSRMPVTGMMTTHAANHMVTDSAASGTAIATGTKTYKGALGLDADNNRLSNIREELQAKGLATGVVSTSSVTHATPASFIAHNKNRNKYEEIALDFLNAKPELFIGGGVKHFEERKDGRNLSDELREQGYSMVHDLESLADVDKSKPVGALLDEVHLKGYPKRGEVLPEATRFALDYLSADPDGFFIMIEGSQIDWGGHGNDTVQIVNETLDFDRAVGIALAFARERDDTLVIVTSDHETGGLGVENGDFATGRVEGDYTSDYHTAEPVPVFAYGPGALLFTGMYDNTDIAHKIRQLTTE